MDDTALLVQTACVWEVCARKLGNVTRHRDFADAGLTDFLLSAAAIAPVLAADLPLGETIRDAVAATRRVTTSNTNLGLILALAPLAKCPRGRPLSQSLPAILNSLTIDDAIHAYTAIRMAKPGGLGRVEAEDVTDTPTVTLRDAMALAADRDLIARQYVTDFHAVLTFGLTAFRRSWVRTGRVEAAILETQIAWLAAFPDSLIARKNGDDAAISVWRLAQDANRPGPIDPVAAARLDAHLRSDGHRLNPGTTADLIAAVLFAALHDGIVTVSAPFSWECDSWPSGIGSA
jgi:triphosphoribosyl-dephospho-CoA synthase